MVSSRNLDLDDRKRQHRGIAPQPGERLLYGDHVKLAGEEFFQLACERDLEGIVAKRTYLLEWLSYLVQNQKSELLPVDWSRGTI